MSKLEEDQSTSSKIKQSKQAQVGQTNLKEVHLLQSQLEQSKQESNTWRTKIERNEQDPAETEREQRAQNQYDEIEKMRLTVKITDIEEKLKQAQILVEHSINTKDSCEEAKNKELLASLTEQANNARTLREQREEYTSKRLLQQQLETRQECCRIRQTLTP